MRPKPIAGRSLFHSWRLCVNLSKLDLFSRRAKGASVTSFEVRNDPRVTCFGLCAVRRRVDSSGCESRPVTGRSNRYHLERFKEVTTWTEALLETAPLG